MIGRVQGERGRFIIIISTKYMSNKLFVGNLSWSTTDQSMKDFFATIGEVISSRVILEKGTNRSRGFGFVEMASAELAQAAVERLNEQDLDGRNIRVSVAMDRPEGDRN
jgi:RNA recognition motif-containing protein